MSDEDRTPWELFLAGLPSDIRVVAEAYPARDERGELACYRSTENPRHHYIIHAFSHDLTVSLVHGSDSTLPGVATFGQPPSRLIPCGCGRWDYATSEQAQETRTRIEAIAEQLRQNQA